MCFLHRGWGLNSHPCVFSPSPSLTEPPPWALENCILICFIFSKCSQLLKSDSHTVCKATLRDNCDVHSKTFFPNGLSRVVNFLVIHNMVCETEESLAYKLFLMPNGCRIKGQWLCSSPPPCRWPSQRFCVTYTSGLADSPVSNK